MRPPWPCRSCQEEFPERKIAAIDTYAASLGEGLLVLEAARMLENGAPFSLIVEQISQRRRTMCQYFTVDDLAYLERGGRVSQGCRHCRHRAQDQAAAARR